MSIKTFVTIFAAACVTACGAQPDTNAAASRGEPATVRFVNIETGCWALEIGTQRVQPLDLPEDFKKDGLAVRVELSDAPDVMSVCQVGPIKRVEYIEKG